MPTKGEISRGFYLDVEPVEVVPVENTEAFKIALKQNIERGNPRVPKPAPGELRSKKPVVNRVDLSEPLGLRDRAIFETFYSTGMRAFATIWRSTYHAGT